MNICLIGFMGTGKSSVACEIASLSDMKALEMDELIEKKSSLKISEIFRIHGEKHFRAIESQVLDELINSQNSVLSCGGGIVLVEKNIEKLKTIGVVILLEAKSETIYNRVKGSDSRPILNNNMSVEHIKKLQEERKPFYHKAADIIISTDELSTSSIAEKALTQAKAFK